MLGYLDDLIIVPAGLALARRMISDEVMCECRSKAEERMNQKGPKNYVAGAIVVSIWLALFALAAKLLYDAVYK